MLVEPNTPLQAHNTFGISAKALQLVRVHTEADVQAVLADAEALLTGEKLIPYWRTGDQGGVNLQKLFLDPAPQDLAGWIQGWSALPYLQKGPLVTDDNWAQFEAMLAGDAMLFAIWLN